MNYDELRIIDFSKGIKSSEVMHNDRALQEQIDRERLAIAGSGVNYGLTMELDGFKLKITDGSVVDIDGQERYIVGGTFDIELPKLINRKQVLFATEGGIITLDDTPYAETRTEPSQFTENADDIGITLYYEDNPSSILNISSIAGKTLYTNATSASRSVVVNYSTAYDRIDTVYINEKYKLAICNGTDSTTPSSYIPEDSRYVLGFVKVNSMYYDDNVHHSTARASIEQYLSNRRTVYTDSSNNLYLCGTPFESLIQIYLREPANPTEGMIWYDMASNKLHIWRQSDNFAFTDTVTYQSSDVDNKQLFTTSVGYMEDQLHVYIQSRKDDGTKAWYKLSDTELEYQTDLRESEKGITESKEFKIIKKLVTGTKVKYVINKYDGGYCWVPVNDTSYVSASECKMWTSNENKDNLVEYVTGLNLNEMVSERKDHDLQTFLFKQDELHLRFTPYKNELAIMINQTPLHRDQFIEITIDDIMSNETLIKMATSHYGYTIEQLENLKNDGRNIGLGFKLLNPLDYPGFIEVNITHRVNVSMLRNKFQRSACFSKTNTIVYDQESTNLNYEIKDKNIIISTLIPYEYGEEQLEVYVDGIRLKKSAITEIVSYGNSSIGASCKKFSLNIAEIGLLKGSEITYKITTNVYSYDHVKSAMEEQQFDLINQVVSLQSAVEKLQRQIQEIQGI